MKTNLKKYGIAILFVLFSINLFSQTVFGTTEGLKAKSKPTYLQFDFSSFIELAEFGLKYNTFNTVSSFNIGIALTSF